MSEMCYEEMKKRCSEYWSDSKANINGMLGGLVNVDSGDIEFSREFLHALNLKVKRDLCLDCGSGIGRVTKNLLLPEFKQVDMLDFSQDYLNESQSFLTLEENSRVRKRICSTLQDFNPDPVDKYGVIWIQWVTGYMSDDDFVNFLNRIKNSLCPDGFIIIKDNVVSKNDDLIDEQDGSYFRTHETYLKIFNKANLKIIKFCEQKSFSNQGLYPVFIFSLQ